MSLKTGTVISIVPDDELAIVVVELHGEAEPISVAHNLQEVRSRGLKRGDGVWVTFDDYGGPTGLVFH